MIWVIILYKLAYNLTVDKDVIENFNKTMGNSDLLILNKIYSKLSTHDQNSKISKCSSSLSPSE